MYYIKMNDWKGHASYRLHVPFNRSNDAPCMFTFRRIDTIAAQQRSLFGYETSFLFPYCTLVSSENLALKHNWCNDTSTRSLIYNNVNMYIV